MDFRKQQREHAHIHINGTVVEKHLLIRRLKKFKFVLKTLTNFYRCTIESILAGCITELVRQLHRPQCRALQRVMRSAQHITGGRISALQDTYSTQCHRNAKKIIKYINYPSHDLFTPLSF